METNGVWQEMITLSQELDLTRQYLEIFKIRMGNRLIYEINDHTGRGLDEDTGKAGIGINNVSQRLESIYGSAASLILKQNHPAGITAIIRVPL